MCFAERDFTVLQQNVTLCDKLDDWLRNQTENRALNAGMKNFWVRGAPGTGKSSTVLLWLRSRSASDRNFNPVWLHVTPTPSPKCTFYWRRNNEWRNITMKPDHLPDLSRSRQNHGFFQNATVFVCDGVTRSEPSTLVTTCYELTGGVVPLVFVSSQQVPLDDKKPDVAMDDFFTMPPLPQSEKE